jgi:hypothetical protein
LTSIELVQIGSTFPFTHAHSQLAKADPERLTNPTRPIVAARSFVMATPYLGPSLYVDG